jgi:hypothetical protein
MNNSSNYEYKGFRVEIRGNTKRALEHLPDHPFFKNCENSKTNLPYYLSYYEKHLNLEKNCNSIKNTFSNRVNRDVIKEIPVCLEISDAIYKITQTQDTFQISFWYFPESDINVYEFRNFDDICEEIKKELDKLTLLSQTMREKILDSISYHSNEIDTNIKLFGAAHILD